MKYIYEFIGTFFLIFTIGMTVVEPNSSPLMAPLAIGAVLAVMVYAGGHVSGAHYNPAVSFALFLQKKLNGKVLILYWIFQCFAALFAGYLTLYLKDFPTQSPISLDVAKALIVEFVFTFALCFVVMNVALAKETKGNSFFGFAIGFIVLVGAYSVGKISGGAFNPAVAFGICVMHLIKWSNIWIFIVANLLGGASAAWVFKATTPRSEMEMKEKKNLVTSSKNAGQI